MRTSCGLPSSVTVKSLAWRPLMGLPSLSLTFTISITRVALASNLTQPLTVRGALVCCCAVATRSQPRNVAVTRSAARIDRIGLEVESQSRIERPHGIGAGGEAEQRVADRGIPVVEDHVVKQVGGVEAQVEVLALSQAEGPAGGSVEAELSGSGDDVPSGVAPLAGRRQGEGRGIEIGASHRSGIDRETGQVGPQGSGNAGSAGGGGNHG